MTDNQSDQSATTTLAAGELPVTVRKWVTQVEEVLIDGTRPTERPIKRAVIAAVIENPYANHWVDHLEILEAGIVGENGELEHIAALLHPRFGAPTRGMSGGVSILPSVKKRGGQGATIDLPVHHKTAMMIRSHFDAIEFRVADAPAANEIVVALAVSDGGRPQTLQTGSPPSSQAPTRLRSRRRVQRCWSSILSTTTSSRPG
jgi:hypothetical protein